MRKYPIPNHRLDKTPANGPVITSYISKEEAAAIVPQPIPRNHKLPIMPTFKKKNKTGNTV